MPKTKIVADPRASEAYGALLEGVHIAGYSFERACTKLEWLLEDNRWRGVGGGFEDINTFMDSIRLADLRGSAEQRQRIAKRIKALQPAVSNRRIANVLGASHQSVGRDLGPSGPRAGARSKDGGALDGPSGPPALGGAAAAQVIARREKSDGKVERREARERELGTRIAALPDRRYGVILADPEWRFEPWGGSGGGTDRAAENHYPTSDLDTIKARGVAGIAAEDAVLFLWATVPMEDQAHEVLKAWGFRYVSQWVWVKDKIGTGYWNRNRHELLLLGVMGSPPMPAFGTQWPSVIEAQRGKHSEKPDVVYAMIEQYFPTLPKIELNARTARAGWDRWGLEAPAEAAE